MSCPSARSKPPDMSIVLAANLLALFSHAISIFILSRLGSGLALLYAGFCLLLELVMLIRSEEGSYYLGKSCGGCLGRLFRRWLKKRPASSAASLHGLGHCLASLAPIATGTLLLTRSFSWPLLVLTLILLSLPAICASLPVPKGFAS